MLGSKHYDVDACVAAAMASDVLEQLQRQHFRAATAVQFGLTTSYAETFEVLAMQLMPWQPSSYTNVITCSTWSGIHGISDCLGCIAIRT